MRSTIILADAVQAADNKLFILGGGWSFTGPDVGPMGVAVLVEVGWHEANAAHTFRLELQDSDGRPAVLGEDGQVLRVEGSLEVGRPPGHPPGTPFNVPLAVNFGPMPLAPGDIP